MDLKEEDILGENIKSHWYYTSKAKAMMHLISGSPSKKLLDVGAGSGFFSKYLLKNNLANEAWCVDTGYEADLDEKQEGRTIHYRRSIDKADADIVLLMDVIEHVEDDIGLLREYSCKVPAHSRFFITVPAFNCLWSGHDDFLEHKRRYSLPQLEATVKKADLKIIKGGYLFGLLLPVAALARLTRKNKATSQLTDHHPIINKFLGTICKTERLLINYNRLGGLTAFCLAEKHD